MQRSKVDGQPAYVLHSYPFRETSLIVEVFTRDLAALPCWRAAPAAPAPPCAGCCWAFSRWNWAGQVKAKYPT